MSFRRPEHPERVALVVVVLLAVVTIAVLAGASQVNGPAEVKRPVAIVQLIPNEGELVPPQNSVGAQVRTDFTAQLTIDGRLIPQDQVSGDPNLGEFFFEPGPNKEFSVLPKGHNSAVVEWWPRTISVEQAHAQRRIGSYSWAFSVG